MPMKSTRRAARRGVHKPGLPMPAAAVVSIDVLNAAFEQHKRGELEDAELRYREILQVAPDHPDALHLLGVIRVQQGDGATAANLIARAIERNPNNPDYHANLGAAFQKLGRTEEAERAYRQALSLNPALTEPLTNLAAICHDAGRLEEAEACCRQALAVNPALAKALRKIVDLAFQANRHADAVESLERLIALDPRDAASLNNLGFVFDKLGRQDEAVACYRQAVAIDSKRPEFLNNLGALLRRVGLAEEGERYLVEAKSADTSLWPSELARARWLANLGDSEGAIAALLPVAEAGTDDVELLITLGATLGSVRRFREAHRWLVKALDIDPENAEAMFHLGRAFVGMKEDFQAECAFRKAVQFRPGYVEPHLSICELMDVQQRRDEANIWARAAIHLPGFSPGLMVYPFKAFRTSCDFEAIEGIGDIWAAANAALNFGSLPAALLYLLVEADSIEKLRRVTALHRAAAERIEANVARSPLPPLEIRRGEGRLRVGLMSYDLRDHSVAKFVKPLLRNYDRDRIELVAYSLRRAENDSVQEEIRGLVDRFVDVEVETDRGLAESIRADGVEILIDLGGFTAGSRINALAYRMAPIQVCWLGYPYTTGFKDVDYTLVDPFVMPTEPALFVERSMPVPHSWACFEGYPDVPIDPTPPCERNGFVTFGTLNNSYKFSPACIAAWAEVLRAVPGSRFLVVRPEGQERVLAANLMKAFGRHGIEPERLFIKTNQVNQHFGCYNEIDIALDTFPLTGGTTTCDALWMGVPTVSLRGPGMHQRLSHSLLNNANLGELSVDNVDAFVQIAVALAGERDSLRLMRAALREAVKNSPLCRGDIFAEGFRDAIWRVARERGLR